MQILEEKEEQRLSSNWLTFGDREIDDVYVPLGWVERQRVTQRCEDAAAEEGSDLYREKEVTQKFDRSEFLEQVLRQGSSPKSNGKQLEIIGKAEVTAEIKEDFAAQFNADRVWLVFDAADEMAVGDGNPLAEIQRQIRTGGCIQKARMVLSCRQNVWDAIGTALDTFDTYRTLDFSYPEQVEMFIYKQIPARSPKSSVPNSIEQSSPQMQTFPQFATPPNSSN